MLLDYFNRTKHFLKQLIVFCFPAFLPLVDASVTKNFSKHKQQPQATTAYEKKLKKQFRTWVHFKIALSKNASQKYEHKQEKISINKTSKKQPCPTINSKITTKFFYLFGVSKMTT